MIIELVSLGWIVSADAGCAGNRRIFVERAVWYEILPPGIISAWCVWCWCLARCSWCVLIILLSIWYNVCACHSPVYHYITATAVYLIQRFITACVVVMWSQSLYPSRMNSQCVHYVCCKSTSTRLKERFEMKYSWCRQTYTRYHICLMRVLIIPLSIRYNVCACHSPVYHYITATAVYLIPGTTFHTCLRRGYVIT